MNIEKIRRNNIDLDLTLSKYLVDIYIRIRYIRQALSDEDMNIKDIDKWLLEKLQDNVLNGKEK